MMWLNILIGVILIIDGIISIIWASPSRVTLNLLNISSVNIVYIGHFFRLVRILMGVLIIVFSSDLPSHFAFIGIYLLVDSFFSILTAKAFSSPDDYFRISRILIGGYLISNFLK